MDHAEARELLELAAVEPDGFDRLAAGDTPESAMLAGHLAGCAECSAELERLRRSSELIRDAVRTTAPPELKQRTLAFVAAVGRDRTTLATGPVGAATAIPVAEPVSIEDARSRKAGGIGRLGLWAATVAAGIAIALVATQLLIVGPQNAQIADQQRAVNALAKAAAWTAQIQGEPNAEQVALVSTSGDADLSGTITYAPGTDRLVVLAQGLEEPPAGTEYRCWVESGGQRVPIGQMFFAGDVAFWVGQVPDIGEVGEDVTFGVSPSPADDPKNVSADPVLTSEAG
jgi:anti-sigma-K factor RskA